MESINNREAVAITYERVASDAQTLKDCATTMENIFSSFEETMNRLGSEDVSEGDYAESFQGKFNELKQKFDTYVQKVNQFSEDVTMASEKTANTEKELTDLAEDL